jgi:hypothetical protein
VQTAVISNSESALKAGMWASRPSRCAHSLQ